MLVDQNSRRMYTFYTKQQPVLRAAKLYDMGCWIFHNDGYKLCSVGQPGKVMKR